MNRETTGKFVKYIAEMADHLARQNGVDRDQVDTLNRELENFKTKLRDENGHLSAQYLDLAPLRLELDRRSVEGTGLNILLAAFKALGSHGLLHLLLPRRDEMRANREKLRQFKEKLRDYLGRFDDYNW